MASRRRGRTEIWSKTCHQAFCSCISLHVGGRGNHQLCHVLHHQGYIPVSISECSHGITKDIGLTIDRFWIGNLVTSSGVIMHNASTIHATVFLSSSYLLSKIIKIKLYKTIILSVFLYGWENWSLALTL